MNNDTPKLWHRVIAALIVLNICALITALTVRVILKLFGIA